MALYTFVVFTNPVTGQEDLYNEWYNNQHLADVTRIPGYIAAQRFEFVPVEGVKEPMHRYMALYTVDTDDLTATHKALMDAAGTPALPLSAALDLTDTFSAYFRAIVPVQNPG